ncbi:MAG TPA: HAMP domain-containing sensor histidine kinase [Candidatus Binatia bacterium]|nr:HAMP domain-containing sensor histidine kinase [Candidatus Binatia bacterium]
MTLRARLTLLFVAGVQVTFLSAVAAYWAVQSWRVLTDDVTLVSDQNVRLDRVLEAAARGRSAGRGDAALRPPAARAPASAADAAGRDAAIGDPGIARALRALRQRVQTRDESRRVDALADALASPAKERLATAARRLRAYYQAELQRLRMRGQFLVRLSTGLVVAIVLSVIAGFLGFLWAIRAWLVEPVRALERATEVMSTGDLSHRIALRGQDEFARLGASINAMAESLARIQAELVERERFALLGELAAYVAHNIRNPLASIRATAQGEIVDLDGGDPRRGVFEDIVRAADRLGAWVADLLRSASPVVLERREGRIGDVVAHCAEMARPRLSAAQLEVDLEVAPTPALRFDQAKIEQVLSAVLSNAIDASPPRGHIRMTVGSDSADVVLRVADEGPGIPAARRARLFAPFSSTKPSGTGIGLWLSQKIVVAHGGSISLLEGGDTGTTVEIRLPAGS